MRGHKLRFDGKNKENYPYFIPVNPSYLEHCISTFTVIYYGARVLGKLPVWGRLLIWIRVGQGPTALAVGAGGGCLDFFSLVYLFSFLSPSLWETAQYRQKYCLKRP